MKEFDDYFGSLINQVIKREIMAPTKQQDFSDWALEQMVHEERYKKVRREKLDVVARRRLKSRMKKLAEMANGREREDNPSEIEG